MVDYFKNLFNKLVKFIKNKMFSKEKERENYWKVSKDMYGHRIFSDDTIESIKIKVVMTLNYRLEVL